jgi:hypothetical protein
VKAAKEVSQVAAAMPATEKYRRSPGTPAADHQPHQVPGIHGVTKHLSFGISSSISLLSWQFPFEAEIPSLLPLPFIYVSHKTITPPLINPKNPSFRISQN